MQASRLPVLAPSVSAPPLLRRRSSAHSKDTPSLPRTPTCGSPIPFFLSNVNNNNNNRKSSDSWNSWEEGDDMEWDWLPEHVLLLTRTLDALPAHVLTPFNGMPPANLLDKISRGVTSAKGPGEWPHSVRATRLKLLELSRVRAKEVAYEDNIRALIHESCADCDEGCSQGHRSHPARRPLYRQSSMDFARNASVEAKNSDTIARLSSRLQRAERIVPGSPHHRFRPESPLSRQYPILNPSTPSSTTLNSTTTGASRIPVRSSTISVSSDMSADSYTGAPMLDPRVQRIRRSGSFGSTTMQSDTSPQRQRNLKRAPSYGSTNSSNSTRINPDDFVRQRKDSAASTLSSSDEEEKARTKHAKKARRKSPPPESPAPKAKLATKKKVELGASLGRVPAETSTGGVRRPRANVQRNPSIFGPELPPLAAPEAVSGCPSAFRAHTPNGAPLKASPALPPLKSRIPKRERRMSIATPPADTPLSLATSPPRLRRMRGTTFSPSPALTLATGSGPSRRISFGTSASPVDENMGSPLGLQSAFQLH